MCMGMPTPTGVALHAISSLTDGILFDCKGPALLPGHIRKYPGKKARTLALRAVAETSGVNVETYLKPIATATGSDLFHRRM